MERVHGTCVAIGEKAVLLRGPSACGKSDLALRIIDGGGCLVADDQTLLFREGERLLASSPATIAGQLEVRGIGIVSVDSVSRIRLSLVADLVAAEQVERLPEPGACTLLGLAVPMIRIAPFEVSAAAKLRLVLQQMAPT